MEEALAVIERPNDALALNRAPDLVLEEARKAAKAIGSVIEGKEKKVVFNGKTYLQFEDWQTVGRFYGVTAMVTSSKYVEFGEGDDRVKGFEATASALLVSTNQTISCAEAMCLNDEPNWARKPLFQLKSMAQTRACAKAMRNVLAWVVVLAGYSGAPAEEMTEENGQQYVQSPQRKSQQSATEPSTSKVITEKQAKRLFALGKKHNWTNEGLRELLGKHGFEHSADITMSAYEKICDEVQLQIA